MPRKATPNYNLQTVNPTLAKQWHPAKNGSLTPKDVKPKSHKRVWWICTNNHEWEAPVYDRSAGKGCPYCSGRLATEENCLQAVNPTLAKLRMREVKFIFWAHPNMSACCNSCCKFDITIA